MKKIFTAFALLFILGTSAFATEAKDIFTKYNPCIEKSNIIINAGMGVDYATFSVNSGTGYSYFRLPPADVTVEKIVPIGDIKLPFGFGGGASWSLENWSNKDFHWGWNRISVFGIANYHFNIPVKNLDVYGGMRAGWTIGFYSTNVPTENNHSSGYFYWGTLVGASYYFSDIVGVNLEIGYPYLAKLAVSLKF